MKELGITIMMAPDTGNGKGGAKPGKAVRALLESARDSVPMGEVATAAAGQAPYQGEEMTTAPVSAKQIEPLISSAYERTPADVKQRLAQMGKTRLNQIVGAPNHATR